MSTVTIMVALSPSFGTHAIVVYLYLCQNCHYGSLIPRPPLTLHVVRSIHGFTVHSVVHLVTNPNNIKGVRYTRIVQLHARWVVSVINRKTVFVFARRCFQLSENSILNLCTSSMEEFEIALKIRGKRIWFMWTTLYFRHDGHFWVFAQMTIFPW